MGQEKDNLIKGGGKKKERKGEGEATQKESLLTK